MIYSVQRSIRLWRTGAKPDDVSSDEEQEEDDTQGCRVDQHVAGA